MLLDYRFTKIEKTQCCVGNKPGVCGGIYKTLSKAQSRCLEYENCRAVLSNNCAAPNTFCHCIQESKNCADNISCVYEKTGI